MAIAEKLLEIPNDDIGELEKAVADAMSGRRASGMMDHAAERMDRMREEMRRRVGVGEWAVVLTRETRDEE